MIETVRSTSNAVSNKYLVVSGVTYLKVADLEDSRD